jgi:hypothetical protein
MRAMDCTPADPVSGVLLKLGMEGQRALLENILGEIINEIVNWLFKSFPIYDTDS